jgi:hypothetical protein
MKKRSGALILGLQIPVVPTFIVRRICETLILTPWKAFETT